jgi:hypothetical protein
MAQDSAFDVANQVRELAEKNIEQAHAAYGHYVETMAHFPLSKLDPASSPGSRFR